MKKNSNNYVVTFLYHEVTDNPNSSGFNIKYLMVNKFLKQNNIDYYEINNNGRIPSKASAKTYLKFHFLLI